MKTDTVSPAMGIRVTGIDAHQVNEDLIGELRRLLLKHHVVVIAGQSLHAEELQAFGQAWGELMTHPSGMNKNVPFVQTLANKRSVRGRGLGAWHSDMTWHPTPPWITMLHARKIPKWGGDTGYANQQLAWEALELGAKDRGRMFRRTLPTQEGLLGLCALHTGKRFGANVPDSIHPIVRTHNETGKQALYVNPEFTSHIVDVTEEDSQNWLWPLWLHGTMFEFTYRHAWSPGDLVIWDNRSVMHTAILDYEDERIMQRVILKGDTPV
ncbi:MAG: TauD/TfdA family dioxygenase [Pseudomonadota bacterium]